MYNLSLLSRGAVGAFFSTIWRNIYWFLMAISGSKMLGRHLETGAYKIWCLWCVFIWVLFGVKEVTFISISLFLTSNFCCLINLFAPKVPKILYIVVIRHSSNNRSWQELKVPKRPYIVVIRHSLNSRSRKEGNERFWKMKNGARYGNLPESIFFSNIWVVRIPRQWSSWPGLNEWLGPRNVIVCDLDKKIIEFQLWWKKPWILCTICLCFRKGLLVSFSSTISRNIYWFLMSISGSKMLGRHLQTGA